jgi:uncharacterized damage-inducible protein DinB
MEMLTNVPAEQATAKPLAGVHSIHEIVLHLTRWVELASMALHGQAIPQWPIPDDWPSVDGTPWHRALMDLRLATEELATYVERLSEAHLDEQTPGRQYSNGILLLGVVQHAAYHGGQIALLKKLTRL